MENGEIEYNLIDVLKKIEHQKPNKTDSDSDSNSNNEIMI